MPADKQTTGTADTFGVASPDMWMAGWIAAERGEAGKAPVWFVTDDKNEWLAGWNAYHAKQ